MLTNLAGWHLIVLLIYPAMIALGFWLLYTAIRLGTRKGLRQHQEWLDSRGDTLPTQH